MKKTLSLAFIFAVAAAVSICASAKEVMATITSVSPIYSDRVLQQQVCEPVYNDQLQIGAVNPGSVIGGIAGALLGSRVGGGNGKVAMTALGAVTGAMSGDRIVQSQRSSQPQQVCHLAQRLEQQISGYRVTYQYLQETYQTDLPYDPSRGGALTTVPAQMNLSLR